MIFQEPMTSLNPCFTVGFQIDRGAQGARGPARVRKRRSGLSSCWNRWAFRRRNPAPERLSASAVGRHEPAGDDRHGDRLQSAPADRRRADHGARRDDPGADPRPLLRSLQKDRGMALVLITHDMGVVAETAQRVTVMYAGQQVEVRGVEDCLSRVPSHPYTAALLARAAGAQVPTTASCRPSPASCPVPGIGRAAVSVPPALPRRATERACELEPPSCCADQPARQGALPLSADAGDRRTSRVGGRDCGYRRRRTEHECPTTGGAL